MFGFVKNKEFEEKISELEQVNADICVELVKLRTRANATSILVKNSVIFSQILLMDKNELPIETLLEIRELLLELKEDMVSQAEYYDDRIDTNNAQEILDMVNDKIDDLDKRIMVDTGVWNQEIVTQN
ncbi:hypothetical protein [Methanobrevibacter sp. DSM 116169]|uniref:hypothetical protein n=1 Tax=Methanobrevibacter sp. DSM 116169 TaxID=3242727 RepID=UPI0038FCEADD